MAQPRSPRYKLLSLWYMLLYFVAIGYAPAQTIHIYGPGGPMEPLKECAAVFTTRTHIPVVITSGPEKEWFRAAQTNADLIYGGAEYMLTQFGLEHPDFLLEGSRVEVYQRPIGMLVRSGNPKHILHFSDLTRPGIKILDVTGAGQTAAWEDIGGRLGLIPAFQANIAKTVANSAQAISAWNSDAGLDAWVTYESWGKRLPETVTVVHLPPGEQLHRGTPIAVAARSGQKTQSQAFLSFLKTPEAHAIFVKWGWD